MHFWRGTGYAVPGVYDSAEKFFRDLAAVYRAEIAALAAAGCRYIQLDEVALAMLCDPVVAPTRDRRRQRSGATDQPLCRGARRCHRVGAAGDGGRRAYVPRQFKGKYLAEGGYDAIAKALFGVTGVTHFLLEFDTARAGDFAPLRFVAADKGVVLGLVSSKSAALEKADDLLKRIEEAARFIDKDRLAISPPMRLRLYRRRQSAHRSRRARQAGAVRADRSGGVGLRSRAS